MIDCQGCFPVIDFWWSAYGENSDHTVTLNPPNASSSVVFAYAGPAPPSGSGPHRYVGLTYVQPDSFTAPTIASTSAFK